VVDRAAADPKADRQLGQSNGLRIRRLSHQAIVVQRVLEPVTSVPRILSARPAKMEEADPPRGPVTSGRVSG